MSKAKKGKYMGRKNPNWGKRPSLETRQKISRAHKGKKLSLEHRRKIGEAQRGKKNPSYGKDMSGENNPHWKGGRRRKEGYVQLLRPDHPRADHQGYVFEHILVLEEKLGRPLRGGEVSHHINDIKDDNRPENLTTFPSHAEHATHHNELRRSNG